MNFNIINNSYQIFTSTVIVSGNPNLRKQIEKEFDLEVAIQRSSLQTDLEKKCKKENNLLHYAAKSSDIRLIRELCEKVEIQQLDVNSLLIQKNKENKTALHLAKENPLPEVFNAFLRINAANEEGRSFLHHWVLQNKLRDVEEFLKNCADDDSRIQFLNIADNFGGTPFAYALCCANGNLSQASWNGNEEMVRICLDSFLREEKRFEFLNGKTSKFLGLCLTTNYFHMACKFGNSDSLNTLLNYFVRDKASLEILLTQKDLNEELALNWVIESENIEMVKVITSFIQTLRIETQKQIFKSKDSFGYSFLHLPIVIFDEDRSKMESFVIEIYNSMPREIRKDLIKTCDPDGNNIFHLLAENIFKYSDSYELSHRFGENCQKVFGKLIKELKLDIVLLGLLSLVRNKQNQTPLDILAE